MKATLKVIILCLCAALFYIAAMYGYVQLKMHLPKPIASVSAIASSIQRSQVLMLHQVNTPKRAQKKDAAYGGFELDLNRAHGSLVVGHDEKDLPNSVTLDDIFAAVQNPGEKTWWIDLKTDLTQNDIDQIQAAAAHYGVHPRRLLFETVAGDTARLLTQNGLLILLSVPDSFDKDDGRPEKRAALNAQLEEQLRLYQPYAIAGSFGKYPYLKVYFPHYNKAIYTATTIRPSIKKKFLADAMLSDPTVKIWMQDEYTALPF